jgi:DNA-binding YbaB/EbfC family protein
MIFGDMGNMLKMAREMQKKLKEVKDELSRSVYEGSSRGVVAKVSGDMEIKELKIDHKIVDPNKVADLEKAVKEALDKALKISKDEAANKMKKVTGGMGLPPGVF